MAYDLSIFTCVLTTLELGRIYKGFHLKICAQSICSSWVVFLQTKFILHSAHCSGTGTGGQGKTIKLRHWSNLLAWLDLSVSIYVHII